MIKLARMTSNKIKLAISSVVARETKRKRERPPDSLGISGH